MMLSTLHSLVIFAPHILPTELPSCLVVDVRLVGQHLHELQEVDAAIVVAVRLLHHLGDLLVPEPLAEVEHANAEFIFGYFTVSICIESSECHLDLLHGV